MANILETNLQQHTLADHRIQRWQQFYTPSRWNYLWYLSFDVTDNITRIHLSQTPGSLAIDQAQVADIKGKINQLDYRKVCW